MKKRVFLVLLFVAVGGYGYYRYADKGHKADPSKTVPVVAAGLAAGPQTASAGRSDSAGPARSQADTLLAEGLQTLRSGDVKGAKEIFSGIIRRFPSHPSAVRAAVEMSVLHEGEGDLVAARNALSTALPGLPEGQTREDAVERLERLNGELVFSKKPAADSLQYVVKSGDSLYKIGKRYKITAGFIKRINYLSSDRINVGDNLKVFQGPFDIDIEKSKFRISGWLYGKFNKEYPIGIGKNGSTPEGEFVVENKLVDPVWDPPGPEYAASKASDNPLGTRWIGFKSEYGIHGTIAPETIGREDSRGCVRMLNPDVEEVYDLVVHGSKVTVKP